MPNERLVTARKNQGFTQNEIAQKAGVSARMYQEYEGAVSEPRARLAIRIARSLGSTVEKLWGENVEKTSANPV